MKQSGVDFLERTEMCASADYARGVGRGLLCASKLARWLEGRLPEASARRTRVALVQCFRAPNNWICTAVSGKILYPRHLGIGFSRDTTDANR